MKLKTEAAVRPTGIGRMLHGNCNTAAEDLQTPPSPASPDPNPSILMARLPRVIRDSSRVAGAGLSEAREAPEVCRTTPSAGKIAVGAT